MRFDKWKIFDKKGSNVNPFLDTLVEIDFVTDSQNARGAESYVFTDTSALADEVVITNSGWNYDPATEAVLSYPFGNIAKTLTSSEASINFIDVSVFDPNPSNSPGIGSVDLDISTLLTYPSALISGATFMPIVSTQLVETEHLTIFEESSTGKLIRPYDPINSTLKFRFIDGDEEIGLFEVNQEEQTLIWVNELVFDVSTYIEGTPIVLNIGFRSEDSGVFERRLRGYHVVGGIEYQFMEIVVNSQSVGPDERFDVLSQNFGLPNPKNISKLFKEADINEDMPDWQLLNYKGKHIVLEHDQIMPYIGSYKALINAIKWLGYEDIKVKEWFRDVKEGKKLSLYVPYEAQDRTKTILYFSPEERKNLKKLNELSLIYCITRETGEIDEWGNPLVEECYEYNINEILTKLKALKDWLEKNIIGVNARITDVTGEGVYFERFRSFIYATQDIGSRAEYSQSLTPETIDEDSELVMGEASVGLTLAEITKTEIQDFPNVRIGDFLQYYWDPSNGPFSIEDGSALWWDPSTLYVGSPFSFPFLDLYDVQYKMSVEKSESGVLPEGYVTNPLWVYDNEIKFYEILDSSSVFYEASTGLRIQIEEAFIRDASNDDWLGSEMYSIYPNFYIYLDSSISKTLTYDSSYAVIDGSGIIYSNPVIDSSGIIIGSDSSIIFNPSSNPTYFIVNGNSVIITDSSTKIQSPLQEGYIMESSTGEIWRTNSAVNFRPDSNSRLEYSFDDNYRVPLLSMENYIFTDSNNQVITLETDKKYFLDILDGKIAMKGFVAEPSTFTSDPSTIMYKKEEYFINWTYDSSLDEQKITLNVVYSSPRAPLYLSDPSIYYYQGPDESLVFDNSIYVMDVNHIGSYQIEVFGWDSQNNVYRNFDRDEYKVWTKYPTIWSYIDTPCAYGSSITLCPSALLTPEDVSLLSSRNLYPIFDRQVPLQGLTLEQDTNGDYYINVPSISYFVDNPDPGSIARFYNMTERLTRRFGNIFFIDTDYQWFNNGDDVNLVLFDNGKYNFLQEVSGNITNRGYTNATITGIPPNFEPSDSSTEVYILNNTKRQIFQAINDLDNQTVEVDISTGGSIGSPDNFFRDNQLVGIIIDDVCTGYSWGSAFRVLDSSLTPDPSLFFEGVYHKLKGNIPEFILADPSRYELTAKHAFSTFSDFTIDVETSTEVDNNFQIYLDDIYYHQYYLDNTFVYVNILFDQEKVLDQWYNREEPVPIELLTNWTNYGFFTLNTSGPNITLAANIAGGGGDYIESNTFNVVGGTDLDISINFYNSGGLPTPEIPDFYIQEIGGNDPSTEYTINGTPNSTWVQNNFVHTLDPSTTSAFVRFVDASGTGGTNFKAQCSIAGQNSADPYYNPVPYYPYSKAITVDISTLVILDTYYDPSNYILNQKNIWTVTERDSGDILFRVHNKSVPYIFDEAGTYNVQVEAYDLYGNLKTQYWEGLIKVE